MTDIATNDQGFREEYVLGFFWGDLMALPVFLRVALVPFKTSTSIQRVFAFRHPTSI